MYNITDKQLREELLPMVVSQAVKFKTTSVLDKEDYIQEGILILLKVMVKFDKSYNTKLSNYACKHVNYSLIKQYNKTKQQNISLTDEIFIDLSDSFWEYVPDNLTELERKIIEYKIKNYTLQEISYKIGCDKEWTNKILNKAKYKIREANV